MATIKPREEPTRALAMWRVFPLPRRSTSAQIVVQNLAVAGGYIAQWLERLTADQQVPGSTPGAPFWDEVVFAKYDRVPRILDAAMCHIKSAYLTPR